MGAWIETSVTLSCPSINMSHPAWVRGLKLLWMEQSCIHCLVAPCVGAWIETMYASDKINVPSVAPCVGAWIETSPVLFEIRSWNVAPCVGAWIETPYCKHAAAEVWCRTLRGCVDWNIYKHYVNADDCGRTLRGCVDWNTQCQHIIVRIEVAPCVGAWIETLSNTRFPRRILSRTLRGCVDWNWCKKNMVIIIICRTLRGCVDWNIFSSTGLSKELSRTLRGCVYWSLSN